MTAARQLKREGEKIGIQIGRKEGMQEGMHQKAIEIAKSMIQRDLATSLIQEVTGLSKQTIEELKRD